MRLKSLSLAIGLFLVPALTFTLQAEDAYSKHCAPPSTYTNLTPGTWKGTFEQVDTAQLTGALDFKYKSGTENGVGSSVGCSSTTAPVSASTSH
jgi:hypothetical protein